MRVDPLPLVFIVMLAFSGLWPLLRTAAVTQPAKTDAPIEWAESIWVSPGAVPRKLPLSAVEQRFARQFPGHIGRFTDGRQDWIVRVMDKPTRMLHPAADCFRGLGYQLSPPKVQEDGRGEQWRCFTASRNGKNLRVCERIFDLRGGRWTDTSAWYWSALFSGAGGASGPWWAVTRVDSGESS